MEGLNWEKKIPILKKYYDDENFNNNYLLRYNEVNKFLKLINVETLKSLKSDTQEVEKTSTNKFIEKFKIFLS